MNQIILWTEWTQAFSALRGAFSRQTTFWWMFIACAGMTIRTDKLGVTSITRAMGLADASYHGLLRMFHSSAIDLEKLLELWMALCFRIFKPVCIDGYMVLIGDGIKVGKEGKKMPAVKSLYQDSQNNSKAEFMMGHYLQAFCLAVTSPLGSIAAIPLVSQIHDGIVWSNRSKKTVLGRFVDLVVRLTSVSYPAIVVADAYYAAKSVINPLMAAGCHLVTRVKYNVVAYSPPKPPKIKRRGRPQKYGKKLQLRTLFKDFGQIAQRLDDCSYYCIDLLWPPAKRLVRFVLVDHDTKGRIILMSSHVTLDPITIIKLYRVRWLIESGFKQAIHVIGTYAYHFWMKAMIPIKRCSSGQYIHRANERYRAQVRRKLKAMHVHLMIGCIAQGLALHLAINFRERVWAAFSGWLRTMRATNEPSELVVANALRTTFPNFLAAASSINDWRKFLLKRVDLRRKSFMTRVA